MYFVFDAIFVAVCLTFVFETLGKMVCIMDFLHPGSYVFDAVESSTLSRDIGWRNLQTKLRVPDRIQVPSGVMEGLLLFFYACLLSRVTAHNSVLRLVVDYKAELGVALAFIAFVDIVAVYYFTHYHQDEVDSMN